MKHPWSCWLLVSVLFIPGVGSAVTEDNFEVDTAKDLLELCTASAEDPLFAQAINYCHGFLVGAFHYYEASTAGSEDKRFVCPPDPAPSRDETIAKLVDWLKNHPQYWEDEAVEVEFRFLEELWPCKS